MRTSIKTTRLLLTSAISDYIDKKIADIEKFISAEDESVSANIEIEKTTAHHHSGDIFRAEINMHIAGGNLRAEATKEDLHAALDEIKDEIIRELSTQKNKRETLIKKGGRVFKRLLRGFPKK
ncbi:MAG: ribosome-associated translation inhibitor RaiA [Parcubacteria group bacterium]|nr:ribosome-associated translation inhibitor RaiA [Parcubacteria group bacterium]